MTPSKVPKSRSVNFREVGLDGASGMSLRSGQACSKWEAGGGSGVCGNLPHRPSFHLRRPGWGKSGGLARAARGQRQRVAPVTLALNGLSCGATMHIISSFLLPVLELSTRFLSQTIGMYFFCEEFLSSAPHISGLTS